MVNQDRVEPGVPLDAALRGFHVEPAEQVVEEAGREQGLAVDVGGRDRPGSAPPRPSRRPWRTGASRGNRPGPAARRPEGLRGRRPGRSTRGSGRSVRRGWPGSRPRLGPLGLARRPRSGSCPGSGRAAGRRPRRRWPRPGRRTRPRSRTPRRSRRPGGRGPSPGRRGRPRAAPAGPGPARGPRRAPGPVDLDRPGTGPDGRVDRLAERPQGPGGDRRQIAPSWGRPGPVRGRPRAHRDRGRRRVAWIAEAASNRPNRWTVEVGPVGPGRSGAGGPGSRPPSRRPAAASPAGGPRRRDRREPAARLRPRPASPRRAGLRESARPPRPAGGRGSGSRRGATPRSSRARTSRATSRPTPSPLGPPRIFKPLRRLEPDRRALVRSRTGTARARRRRARAGGTRTRRAARAPRRTPSRGTGGGSSSTRA